MRYFRPIVITLFFLVSIIFLINWYQAKHAEVDSAPVIEFKKDMLKCSIKDGKEALLKDVTAYDEKDGDLTDKIVIESVSKFVDKEKRISNITYAIADSNHNIVKKSRKVQFLDYSSPKFKLSGPLCFDIGSDNSVARILGATDVYDGDISNKVKILSKNKSTASSGEYTVIAQVTNSLGDTVKFKGVVVIKQENNLSPTINLNKYVVYIKKGEKFEPEKYISSVVTNKGKELSKSSVDVVKTNVNTNKTGFYTVEYAIYYGEENEGTTYLTVIVED